MKGALTVNGFSVFMDRDIDAATKLYIKQMAKAGFDGIFTSLHIPEDDPKQYKKRLAKLGALAQKNHLDLMVDIAGDALFKAGFSLEQISELKKLGVTGLRADDQLSLQAIAQLSHEIFIGLNASTLIKDELLKLKALDADLTQIIAWHNYYPRPETGLDNSYFCKQNAFLKQNDLQVVAFIPGDDCLRYPLYQGLPTLESQRYLKPLLAYLELKALGVDGVYIGDSGLLPDSQKQFASFLNTGLIVLHAKRKTNDFSRVIGQHQNRKDVARDVIRSATARLKVSEPILPDNTTFRAKGALTLDNCDYGRYMGEFQLVKHDLKADPRVNVIGQVIEAELELLAYIGAGQRFEIVEVKNNGSNEFNN